MDTITGCFYIVFFINLQTRRVVLGSITGHPYETLTQQVARNLTDAFDGPLVKAKYLVHDRDSSRAERDGPRSYRPTNRPAKPEPTIRQKKGK